MHSALGQFLDDLLNPPVDSNAKQALWTGADNKLSALAADLIVDLELLGESGIAARVDRKAEFAIAAIRSESNRLSSSTDCQTLNSIHDLATIVGAVDRRLPISHDAHNRSIARTRNVDGDLKNWQENVFSHAPTKLKPSAQKAGASFERVESRRPDLSPPAASLKRYCKAQWDHIRDHYDDIYPIDDRGRSDMPSFESWGRYVREYLRDTSGNTSSPRPRDTGSKSFMNPDGSPIT